MSTATIESTVSTIDATATAKSASAKSASAKSAKAFDFATATLSCARSFVALKETKSSDRAATKARIQDLASALLTGLLASENPNGIRVSVKVTGKDRGAVVVESVTLPATSVLRSIAHGGALCGSRKLA